MTRRGQQRSDSKICCLEKEGTKALEYSDDRQKMGRKEGGSREMARWQALEADFKNLNDKSDWRGEKKWFKRLPERNKRKYLNLKA